MSNLMIPVKFMKLGYIVIPIMVIYIIMSFVKNQVVKGILYLLKALAYFGLAYFMWKFYDGKEQIDVISSFTFIFCCFESADNVISLLSIPIEYIHKLQECKIEDLSKKIDSESQRRM